MSTPLTLVRTLTKGLTNGVEHPYTRTSGSRRKGADPVTRTDSKVLTPGRRETGLGARVPEVLRRRRTTSGVRHTNVELDKGPEGGY